MSEIAARFLEVYLYGCPQAERGGVMNMRSMDFFWPIGRTFGLGAEDTVWVLGLCAGTLLLTPMFAIYILLFF